MELIQTSQKMMRKIFRSINSWLEQYSNFRMYALLLLATMAIAYKLQVSRLGTYYDDWEGVFLYKQGFSAKQIWDYFLVDRPFSSLIHITFDPLFGASNLGWHMLGLLLNWGAVLLLVKIILHLWPSRVMEAGWIGLLMGVYPGMQRQFIVHTSAPHYMSMFLFCLSVYLMLKATDEGRYRHALLFTSVLFAALQVLIIEYFTALELIRPFLLFLAFRKKKKTNFQAIRSALAMYIPYGIVFLGFLVFKFKILPSIQLNGEGAKHQIGLITSLKEDLVTTIFHYMQIVLQDVIHGIFFAWTIPISLEEINLQSKFYLFSWFMGCVLALTGALVIRGWYQQSKIDTKQDNDTHIIILLCISALLLGGLPAWIIDRQAIVGIWSDRFLFGQIFGAVPLIVILIIGFTGQNRRKAQSLMFALLLAGSISQQIRLGNKYAATWTLEQNYYWQLKWRAPSLEENTFILSPYTPFDRNSAYQIAYAVNVMYAPPNGNEQAPVWWFDGPSTVTNKESKQYIPGAVNVDFRSLKFRSELKRAIPVVYREGRSCLQVLDPIYTGEPILNDQEKLLFSVAYSNHIKAEEDKPMPTDVFGSEPPHGWCYYFQKADLARSFEQWDEVIRLWNEAEKKNLNANYGPEYLPFIDAFAQKEDWEMTSYIFMKSYTKTEKMSPVLCSNLSRIMQKTVYSIERQQMYDMLNVIMSCHL